MRVQTPDAERNSCLENPLSRSPQLAPQYADIHQGSIVAMEQATHRWTDEFLDIMRREGDPEADACVAQLLGDRDPCERNSAPNGELFARMFGKMNSNDDVPPGILFPELAEFFLATQKLPDGIDLERIDRGEMAFSKYAFDGALVLLAKSLPEGYAAPNLATILMISGQLKTNTYRRLLATLQTVLNVTTCHGFEPGGQAVITAQKLRLMHAGVRVITPCYRKDYVATYGIPVNHEDMLATIIGFSYLVIDGMKRLNIDISTQEQEDLLYMWGVFAVMMGIHPPGQPNSFAYIPDSVEDAGEFYNAYARRHYVSAEANPEGTQLALADLELLERMIPKRLRLIGFGKLPRIYMNELMGREACDRIGIDKVFGHFILKWVLTHLHKIIDFFDPDHKRSKEGLARIMFQEMINIEYGGSVTTTIPRTLADLESMSAKQQHGDLPSETVTGKGSGE